MRKLFYEDCDIKEFTARVTGCREEKGRFLVTLDATAFYPEGGGQACDVGTLGDVSVLDVQEMGEEIVHFCDGPLEIGQEVFGKIQWQRRFDLMQQHTGEHIVSGLIHSRFGWHNSGFHVGKEVMEVDFDGPIDAAALAQIELEANRAVWENIELQCWYPSREELPGIFYRTKRELPWPVRIVKIGDVDCCACCGIHTKTTGQVGLIKILSCVKFHSGVRLEMVCGERAYRYMTAVFDQNRLVSQTFSAKLLETAEAARKVSEALAAEKYRAAGLQAQIFEEIAKGYAGQEKILHFTAGLEPAGVRLLAEKIGEKCDFCGVFSQKEDTLLYCLASKSTDLRPIGKALNEKFQGRGGGKPSFQQGNLRAEQAQIEGFFGEICW